MQHLLDHARSFPDHVARQREHFDELAHGQSSQVLFLTCSGSRAIPSLITGARPGQLFELRTAGNIVPRHDRRLRLHGWFYEVDTGTVLAHSAHADQFLPL
ncbi:carbonic anhydrase [Promicromonospora sp. NPDC052451]|uniref:carbonic anhydrase n=1 Tax=Promicromonospora sp. NPDC052451 TaxID=3364407 RepID=UPI0037C92FE3